MYVMYDLPVLSALQAHLLKFKGFTTFEGLEEVEQVSRYAKVLKIRQMCTYPFV